MNMRVSKSFGIGPKVTGSNPMGGMFGGPGGPPPGGGGRGGMMGGGLGPGGLSGNRGGPPGMDHAGTAPLFAHVRRDGTRNIFNTVNLAPPVPVLSSPLFGKSNALAGGFFSSAASNRSIDLQMSFNF